MTAARLHVREDASALEAHCDRVKLLMDADPRRAVECAIAYEALKLDDAIFTVAPLELDGGVVWYSAPHPRFVALYESLRLRSRLDLPTGEVAP